MSDLDFTSSGLIGLLGEGSELLGQSGSQLAQHFGFDPSAGEFFAPTNIDALETDIGRVETGFKTAQAQNVSAANLARTGVSERLGREEASAQGGLISLSANRRLQTASSGFAGAGGNRAGRRGARDIRAGLGEARRSASTSRRGITEELGARQFSAGQTAQARLDSLLGDLSNQLASIFGTARDLKLADFATATTSTTSTAPTGGGVIGSGTGRDDRTSREDEIESEGGNVDEFIERV